MEEHCVVCGAVIPEGRQVCPKCEVKLGKVQEEKKQENDDD